MEGINRMMEIINQIRALKGKPPLLIDTVVGNPSEKSNRMEGPAGPETMGAWNNPDEGVIKMGQPSADADITFANSKVDENVKCVHCQKPAQKQEWGNKLRTFCPSCRKTFYRSVDESGFFNYKPEMESGNGVDQGWNLPLPTSDNYAGHGNRDGYTFP